MLRNLVNWLSLKILIDRCVFSLLNQTYLMRLIFLCCALQPRGLEIEGLYINIKKFCHVISAKLAKSLFRIPTYLVTLLSTQIINSCQINQICTQFKQNSNPRQNTCIVSRYKPFTADIYFDENNKYV